MGSRENIWHTAVTFPPLGRGPLVKAIDRAALAQPVTDRDDAFDVPNGVGQAAPDLVAFRPAGQRDDALPDGDGELLRMLTAVTMTVVTGHRRSPRHAGQHAAG